MVTESLLGPNGPYQVGVRKMSLSAKGLGVSDLPVTIVPGDRIATCTPAHRDSGAIGLQGCYGFVALELGTDVLSQLRFYLASQENSIYFTLAATNAPATAVAPNAAAPGRPCCGRRCCAAGRCCCACCESAGRCCWGADSLIVNAGSGWEECPCPAA